MLKVALSRDTRAVLWSSQRQRNEDIKMNDKLKTFQGSDGELYKVSAEGFARLLKSPGAGKLKKGKTKRGIGPAGGAPVSKKTGKVFAGAKVKRSKKKN